LDIVESRPELLAGPAHPGLAAAVAEQVGVRPLSCSVSQTADGEMLFRVDESARSRPVVIVQSVVQCVGSSVAESLLELLLLADACHRAGAERVIAAVPYLGYLRQDRRSLPGESLGCRVVADALSVAKLDRLLVVDPHSAGVEAAFSFPVELLTAVPLLASAIRDQMGTTRCVVVAPDLGASKLAQRYARRLKLPVAIIYKQRLSPTDVRVEHVAGDVAGLSPIIVDDMVSTGGTVASAVDLLLARGALPDVVVAATHGLFAGLAAERLGCLPLRQVITTDTVPQSATMPFPRQVVSVVPLLVEAIRRTSTGRPLAELE
jgi:ribose-phosphate pyrophosphokinase